MSDEHTPTLSEFRSAVSGLLFHLITHGICSVKSARVIDGPMIVCDQLGHVEEMAERLMLAECEAADAEAGR